MEAVVLDAVAGILGGVNVDVSLGGVEDVSHPDALQIVHVADGVAVAEDDALVHLQPRTLHRYSPECIHFKTLLYDNLSVPSHTRNAITKLTHLLSYASVKYSVPCRSRCEGASSHRSRWRT